MITKKQKEYYSKFETYEAKPFRDDPLLDQIDNATLIAWFRCNSCTSCRWREKVIDKDADLTIEWCSKTHDKGNIIDMVSYLGYTKEGRERDIHPQYKE